MHAYICECVRVYVSVCVLDFVIVRVCVCVLCVRLTLRLSQVEYKKGPI